MHFGERTTDPTDRSANVPGSRVGVITGEDNKSFHIVNGKDATCVGLCVTIHMFYESAAIVHEPNNGSTCAARSQRGSAAFCIG